jgi:hypothetical protein
MRLEIRRLTAYERDRIRRAVLADIDSRDREYTAREWIAGAFAEIRKEITTGKWSLDFMLGQMIAGPRIRKHNRALAAAKGDQ